MTTIALLLAAWILLLPPAAVAWALVAARTSDHRAALRPRHRPLDLSMSLD